MLFALGLPVAACATADDTENLAINHQAQVTNIISTPDKCNQGVAPGNCVQAPPATTASPRWRVDGVRATGEYAGATQMPYVLNTSSLGGYGTVFAQRVTNTSQVAPKRDVLFLYLDDLAVPVGAGGTPFGKFHIYVDYARFEGLDKYAGTEDRRFSVDLKLETLTEYRTSGSGSTLDWVAMPTEPGVLFRSGGCRVVPSGKSATCDGELQIPLPASVLKSPVGSTLDPGIGMLVSHVEVAGAMPELTSAQHAAATRDRKLWQTVVFGRPRGFPLKVMSWTLSRGENLLFDSVSNAEIGKFLAGNDVVALQEVWRRADALAIANAANVERAKTGKPAFKVYGPIDYEPGLSEVFLEAASWIDETQGGLFVLTPLDTANQGALVFGTDNCRGDDCFRAKGVQWVRLMLNHPDLANPNCREGGAQSCAKPPSGDDYVDIFNMSLQSENPAFCEDDTWQDLKPYVVEALDAIPDPWGEILGWIVDLVEVLVENDMHCDDKTSVQVRNAQLDKANAFIDKISSEAMDRPAIVLGNHNLDGRNIANGFYTEMLRKLEISEPLTPGLDIINQIPLDYAWDVDHGDLARERIDIAFGTGRCLGTEIGFNGGVADLTCTNDSQFDGVARSSFILVRPHATVSLATSIAAPRWVAMKNQTLSYSSPFPTNTGNTGAPPNRLSDHKPVVADITMVPWVSPPKYHPTWGHEAKLAITSVDATNYEDCSGCGNVDPYADLTKANFPAPSLVGKPTTECSEIHQPSWPANDCLSDWYFTQAQTPTVNGFTFQADVLDDDDSPNGNDSLSEYTKSTVTFNAGSGKGAFDLLLHSFSESASIQTVPIIDTEPIQRCDNSLAPALTLGLGMARVCHRLSILEIPPSP
ncbi:MAG: hypothetical protein WKG01_25390 [Kofleriaceae bacterium]